MAEKKKSNPGYSVSNGVYEKFISRNFHFILQ